MISRTFLAAARRTFSRDCSSMVFWLRKIWPRYISSSSSSLMTMSLKRGWFFGLPGPGIHSLPQIGSLDLNYVILPRHFVDSPHNALAQTAKQLLGVEVGREERRLDVT